MYRITLKSNTAFFRNDVTITSLQETFDVPPLSTIHGLIASAYGKYRYDLQVGLVFEYQFKTKDYELRMAKKSKYKEIYTVMHNNPDRFNRNDILRGCMGTIPVLREILFNCVLYLYINDKEVANSFLHPYYALLLGRTEDIAHVCEVKPVSLNNEVKKVRIGRTIIPVSREIPSLPGRIVNINIKIKDSYPRQVIKSGIYYMVEMGNRKIPNFNNMFLYDKDIDYGVFVHNGVTDVSC